jgi:hypothetical protein
VEELGWEPSLRVAVGGIQECWRRWCVVEGEEKGTWRRRVRNVDEFVCRETMRAMSVRGYRCCEREPFHACILEEG